MSTMTAINSSARSPPTSITLLGNHVDPAFHPLPSRKTAWHHDLGNSLIVVSRGHRGPELGGRGRLRRPDHHAVALTTADVTETLSLVETLRDVARLDRQTDSADTATTCLVLEES